MTPREAFVAQSTAKPLAEVIKEAAAIAAQHADDVDRQSRFPIEAVTALKAGRALSAYVPRELGGAGVSLEQSADLGSVDCFDDAETAVIQFAREAGAANRIGNLGPPIMSDRQGAADPRTPCDHRSRAIVLMQVKTRERTGVNVDLVSGRHVRSPRIHASPPLTWAWAGASKAGHICFQGDHGGGLWFKNIKIKTL